MPEALYLSSLDSLQRQVVETVEGPLMVLAGPGTGKTHVLTARIAHILATTDASPENILALTYTDAAAVTMRQRLVEWVGPAGYRVKMVTFHAFCQEVIAAHPEITPLQPGSQPLTELERIEILEGILSQPHWQYLRTPSSPFHYLKKSISAISSLKREGVTVEKLSELVAADQAWFEGEAESLKKAEITKWTDVLHKQTELVELYRSYQEQLQARGRYDFDDMILWVVEAFSASPELLLTYQEQYQYVMVDEYQDTNSAQNRVVWSLGEYWGEQANLCVVGDPHQTIYRFQGASLDNVVSFRQRFPEASVITLQSGFRCPQEVYTRAAAVIEQDVSELSALWPDIQVGQALQSVATAQPQQPVKVTEVPTDTTEYIWVAEEMKRLLSQGVSADQIAVLVRKNDQAAAWAEQLTTRAVPSWLERGRDALELSAIQELLTLCRAIEVVGVPGLDQQSLAVAWTRDWFASPVTAGQIWRQVRQVGSARPRTTLWEWLEALSDSEEATAEAKNWLTLREKMTGWFTSSQTQLLSSWLLQVAKDSGWSAHYLSAIHPDVAETVAGFTSLIEWTKQREALNRSVNLSEWLASLMSLERHTIKLPLQRLGAPPVAVVVTTAHAAKGREWQYVFVPRMSEGNWGGVPNRAGLALPTGVLETRTVASDPEADERRLLYVTLTRARQRVYLSYPREVATQLALKTVASSRYLEMMGKDLQIEQPELAEDAVVEASIAQWSWSSPAEPDKLWLAELARGVVWSPTALQLFLESPEEFVWSVLLRSPRPSSAVQAFGSAIHLGLERFYQGRLQSGKFPKVEEIITQVEGYLRTQPLTLTDEKIRLKQARQVLSGLLPELAVQPFTTLRCEQTFGGGGSLAWQGVRVTGKVDRFDWVDEAANQVKIIDYKTGKPKTPGEITGATASAGLSERERDLSETIRGRYQRQMVFYALLAELDTGFNHQVVGSELWFVEPHRSEAYVVRDVSVTEEAKNDLKELLVSVQKELEELWE